MAAAGETGGLGYFKGVMLCARPVERNVRPERASFCATVTGRAELGVDPSHKLRPRRERKRVVTAIVNHRKWLDQLSYEMETRKQRTVQEMLQEELKRMKVKEKSQQARELVKSEQAGLIKTQVYPLFSPGEVAQLNQHTRSLSERAHHKQPGVQYSQTAQQPENNIFRAASLGKPAHNPQESYCEPGHKHPETLERTLQAVRLSPSEPVGPLDTTVKKTAKPQPHSSKGNRDWSKAAAAADNDMDAEVSHLISFMEEFDAEKYAEDTETRALMANLKDRVEKLKQEPDWKERWEERIKEKRRKREEEYRKQKEEKEADDDNRSNVGNDSQLGIGGASVGSRGDAKSVQSERTLGKLRSHLRSHQGIEGEARIEGARKGRLGTEYFREVSQRKFRGTAGEAHR